MKQTQKKIVLKLKKERNPYVAELMFRTGGEHKKPYKATRAKNRAKLRKEW